MTACCDLTDLLQADCAHCRNVPDPFAMPERTQAGDGNVGPRFTARYGGKCACGETFEPGDTIRADGAGDYLAECCDETDGGERDA